MSGGKEKKRNRKSMSPEVVSSALEHDFVQRRPRKMGWFWAFLLLSGGSFLTISFLLLVQQQALPEQGNLARLPSAGQGVYSSSLSRDVELLKGQMNVLITAKLETKIQQLETSLKSGVISPEDLETIQALREDLKILRAYSQQNAATALALFSNSSGLGETVTGSTAVYFDPLMHEFLGLKNYFYIGMASWGVALMIFGGVWLRGHYRLRQIQGDRWNQYEILEKSKSETY
ncbi:MAG: hypothetical protein NZ729_01350 [Methylococcales bacterium]|nr:hypothetical protein [Methylococcales bacterium]